MGNGKEARMRYPAGVEGRPVVRPRRWSLSAVAAAVSPGKMMPRGSDRSKGDCEDGYQREDRERDEKHSSAQGKVGGRHGRALDSHQTVIKTIPQSYTKTGPRVYRSLTTLVRSKYPHRPK